MTLAVSVNHAATVWRTATDQISLPPRCLLALPFPADPSQLAEKKADFHQSGPGPSRLRRGTARAFGFAADYMLAPLSLYSNGRQRTPREEISARSEYHTADYGAYGLLQLHRGRPAITGRGVRQ